MIIKVTSWYVIPIIVIHCRLIIIIIIIIIIISTIIIIVIIFIIIIIIIIVIIIIIIIIIVIIIVIINGIIIVIIIGIIITIVIICMLLITATTTTTTSSVNCWFAFPDSKVLTTIILVLPKHDNDISRLYIMTIISSNVRIMTIVMQQCHPWISMDIRHCHLCNQYCSHDCHISAIVLMIVIIRYHIMCVSESTFTKRVKHSQLQSSLPPSNNPHESYAILLTAFVMIIIVKLCIRFDYVHDPHADLALWQTWSIISLMIILFLIKVIIPIIHHQRCLQGKVLETAEEGAKSDRGSAPNPSTQSGQSRGPRFATNQGDRGPKRGASLANGNSLACCAIFWTRCNGIDD